MTGNPLILDLVQEILESNRTPEEVCAGHPELLWEVRAQLKRAQKVEAQLAELFPSSIDEPQANRVPHWALGNDLPEIPGYKLEEVIGHGGMGVVFRARHLKLNRVIALKMLLTGAFASRQERARFVREAEAVAALQHPNIVQVFDVGELERRPYFTMELLEGGTLAQRLAGAPQRARQSAQLVATLAAAVAYAHEHGIVHRDLKPGNILLTAENTPKIADFGLARRVDAAHDLTISGARLGTPSYMAPEQASGKTSAIGPTTDVYALGAILYEMLTGRPPFRADSAGETERQVIFEEPARPSRLNASVPGDLETICLKCLDKDPQRRYATASELAKDLERYLQDLPINARRTGRFERSLRWARRKPAAAALIATAFAMTAILVGFGLREWSWAIDRRAQGERLLARLDYVAQLQNEERFDEARATLAGAATESVDLQRQIEKAQADLKLVEQLDAIRLSRGGFVRGGGLDYEATSKAYESLFREAGIAELRESPKDVAARLNLSPIRVPLIWALDDWATCADLRHRLWILAVVRAMDPDPWRDKVRNPLIWDNAQLLSKLADEVKIEEQPVKLLVDFGTRWRRLGGNPTAFLEKVQRRYPNDFWVNFELGHLFSFRNPPESVGYDRAALAIRPNSEAVHYNLGVHLNAIRRYEEAVHHFASALESNPRHTWAHEGIASALKNLGRIDEALEHYRAELALDPRDGSTWRDLTHLLVEHGRFTEGLSEWSAFLASGLCEPNDWDGYAELCLFLNKKEAYYQACHQLLSQVASRSDPRAWERTGRACLLLPVDDSELQSAAGLIDRALTADKSQSPDWVFPYYQIAKALAEYRADRPSQAMEILQGPPSTVLLPAPTLVRAMCQYAIGDVKEARHTLAGAVSEYDWRMKNAVNTEAWIFHVLRRETEALLIPNCREILAETAVAQDEDECLSLQGLCESEELWHASARLYKQAIDSNPKLADDLRSRRRYKAACSAALAGCGQGRGASTLNETEQERWREQAIDWLQADLAAWAGKLNGGSPEDFDAVKTTLQKWKADSDLAGIRDDKALNALPEDMRAKCRELWAAVDEALSRAIKPKK